MSDFRKNTDDRENHIPPAKLQEDLEAESVQEVYDGLADGYVRNYEAGVRDKPFFDEFLSYVKVGTRLLDIGCGTGSGSKYFYDQGMRVEAVDLSERMIQIAAGRFPMITFRKADIRRLSYPTGQLGAVWAGYCLFHMGRDEFKGAVAGIRRCLISGGVFGLLMQEGQGSVEFPEPLLPGKSLMVHLYSATELSTILERNWFEIVKIIRRHPASKLEYPYDKLLLIARAIENASSR